MVEAKDHNNASTTKENASARPPSLLAQIKRHGVALISLSVAIISLSYNTWRNETTEAHRNTRAASFQILLALGELQQVVDYTVYFHRREKKVGTKPVDAVDGTTLASMGIAELGAGQLWVSAWGKAAMVRDLSQLLPLTNQGAGNALFKVWQEHADALLLGSEDQRGLAAEAQISQQILATRQHTLNTLQRLQ